MRQFGCSCYSIPTQILALPVYFRASLFILVGVGLNIRREYFLKMKYENEDEEEASHLLASLN